MSNTKKCQPEVAERLSLLKQAQSLITLVFPNISENLHYEIFRYSSNDDLLEIRALNIGGFMISSNGFIRKFIGNYYGKVKPILALENENITLNIRKMEHILEQTGNTNLYLENMSLGYTECKKCTQIIKMIPQIEGLFLGNQSFIYIYIFRSQSYWS